MRYRARQFLCVCLASCTSITQGLTLPNRTRLSLLASAFGKYRIKSLFSSSTAESNEMASLVDTPKSWRSLLEVSMAKTRKIRGSNYVQLATVEDGEPRCRTVVFRGFQKLPADHPLAKECDSFPTTFKFCTNALSKKVTQNQVQPIGEIVWWFPTTNEQYRFRGQLIMVGEEEAEKDRALAIARKELWGNITDASRETFFGSLVPGEAYQPEDKSIIPTGGRGEDGKPVPPPKNFLLMLLDPTHVDYLLLGGEQYRQTDVLAGGEWTLQRVNP